MRNGAVIERLEIHWSPRMSAGAGGIKTSRTLFDVHWFPAGEPFENRVKLGVLERWHAGPGWLVTPRLGGHLRARRAGLWLARTRLEGAGFLVALARAEGDLDATQKLDLRIVRPSGDRFVDLSRGVRSLPGAAAGEPVGDARL